VIDSWKPDVEGYLDKELKRFNRDIQDAHDKKKFNKQDRMKIILPILLKLLF
jgi:hypothetical protein